MCILCAQGSANANPATHPPREHPHPTAHPSTDPPRPNVGERAWVSTPDLNPKL